MDEEQHDADLNELFFVRDVGSSCGIASIVMIVVVVLNEIAKMSLTMI